MLFGLDMRSVGGRIVGNTDHKTIDNNITLRSVFYDKAFIHLFINGENNMSII